MNNVRLVIKVDREQLEKAGQRSTQLIPEKVPVHRRTGVNLETRMIDPAKNAPKPIRQGKGQWEEGEPVPTPRHVQAWQNDQIQRIEAFAAKNHIPLGHDVIKNTISIVRGVHTNNEVHAFLQKHGRNNIGLSLAKFKHPKELVEGDPASHSRKDWAPPPDHEYIGKKKSGGKYEFWYNRPNNRGQRAMKAPPQDHPDYQVYQQQRDEQLKESSPYLHKYRNMPELTQYPPKDIPKGDVYELAIKDPRKVHLEPALMYVDKNGKQQYCYTRLYRDAMDAKKFVDLQNFASAYPKIRSAVRTGFNRKPGSIDHAMSTIVGLVDRFVFRAGQEEGQEGVGVTLFQKNHLRMGADKVTFNFTGKKGVEWERTLKRKDDPTLFEAVKYYYNHARGENSFLFKAPKRGSAKDGRVSNNMVNDWLKNVEMVGLSDRQKKAIGSGISIKDFRTYHATNMMRQKLAEILKSPMPRDRVALRQKIREDFKQAAEDIAAHMGHTPAVLLASYVNPAVIKYFEHRAGGNYGFIKSLQAEVGSDPADFSHFLSEVEDHAYGGNALRHWKELHHRQHAGFNPERDADQLPRIHG
jgi:DNA topoisomerase IB